MAVNPFAIWYSQEARAYMLLALLTGAAFLAFARSLRAPTRGNLLAWVVLSALAVATHFFAGFAIAPQAILLLWRHRTRASALAVGLVAAAQLAMLPLAISDTSASHGTGWIAKVPVTHRIATTAVEWMAGNLYRRTTLADGLALGAGLVLIIGLLLWFGRRDGEPGRGAMVALVVAACVFVGPLILAGLGQDYFLSRNAIPALVPAVTVLGGRLHGAAAGPGRRRPGGACCSPASRPLRPRSRPIPSCSDPTGVWSPGRWARRRTPGQCSRPTAPPRRR